MRQVREVTLNGLDFCFTSEIEHMDLGAINIDHWVRATARGFEVRLRAIIAGLPEREWVVKHPADWWEALKERWLPQLLLTKWPVRYDVHVMRATWLAPEIPWPKDYNGSYKVALYHTYDRNGIPEEIA